MAKTIICPGCGKQLPETVKVCYMCGVSTQQQVPETKETLADLQQHNALASQTTEVQGPNMNMLLDVENEQAYQQPAQQTNQFGITPSQFDARWKNSGSKQVKSICCPKCKSTNVNITYQTTGMQTKNTSEVRKKSAVARTGNNIGRAGANLATGGIYGLIVPKRSDYKETGTSKTKMKQQKMAICQNCGKSWKVL